jgi:outer membrane protein OmpA-like peptidoglycan-associated protein
MMSWRLRNWAAPRRDSIRRARGRWFVVGLAACAAAALSVRPTLAGPLDGVWDLDSGFKQEPNGITFVNALHAGYIALSKARTHSLDWTDGERWNHKAVTSGMRSQTDPEQTLDWKLDTNQQQELYAALYRLREAFVKGAREANPVPAATAQVSYDCWIEAASEHRTKDVQSCRKTFEDAMAQIDANYGPAPFEVRIEPAAAPQPVAQVQPAPVNYKVYFYFDKTAYTPEGQQQLDQAIQAALADPGAHISLIAHADRAGPTGYNQALSDRRGRAVISSMAARGIDQSRINMVAVGETEPLIPTPDGVAEQGNRVVEVNYAK